MSELVAWALPFGLALSRCSSHAQWRGDVALLRDLGLCGVGWGGGLSTLLSQAISWLPLGSLSFRTALLSCLALAVASRALFSIALFMLRAAEDASDKPRSVFAAPVLAALSTLTATMTPTFQREATVGGSTAIAVAASLWLVASTLTLGSRPRDSLRSLIGWGFLLGAVSAENAVAGLGATLACAASVFALRYARTAQRTLVPLRIAGVALVAWIVGVVLVSLPSLLRALSPHAAVDLGGPYLWGPALPPDLTPRVGLVAAWTDELGVVTFALSCCGAACLAFFHGTRLLLIAPLSFVLLDLLLRGAVGATEGTLALRLLAIGGMACTSTVGLFMLFDKLRRAAVPLARAGAPLSVAFHATVVALIVEQASVRADRNAQTGAEEFTVAALDRLPARAAISVDSPSVTWRVLAATVVEGRRPDVLILPRRLLDKGDVSLKLLALEPKVAPLLRTLALSGTSDEYGLSELADARPLFVEPERGWGPAVYQHISLTGPWLRFEPEPLGSVDRNVDVGRTLRELERFLAASSGAEADRESGFVASGVVVAHAKSLLKIGDVANASSFLLAIDTPGTNRIVQHKSLDVQFSAAVARLPGVKVERDKARGDKQPRAEKRPKEPVRRR